MRKDALSLAASLAIALLSILGVPSRSGAG
jgi:hypothetical protein